MKIATWNVNSIRKRLPLVLRRRDKTVAFGRAVEKLGQLREERKKQGQK
jgi:exonuclease III